MFVRALAAASGTSKNYNLFAHGRVWPVRESVGCCKSQRCHAVVPLNITSQIHLRQFLGRRFSAMDPKFMTEEDMISCGLLPSSPPPSVISSDEDNV